MRTFDRISDELSGAQFYARVLLLNCSESEIASRLRKVQEGAPQVAIGSYPRFGDPQYRVKITVDSRDEAAASSALEEVKTGVDPQWIVDEL